METIISQLQTGVLTQLVVKHWLIISAIAGFITYSLEKEYAMLKRWNAKYFSKILVPFHLLYIEKSYVDIKSFLNQQNIFYKEYVPRYIHYLVLKEEYDDIRKCLIADYETYYPSPKHIQSNVCKNFTNVGEIASNSFFTFAYLVFMVVLVYMTVFFVRTILRTGISWDSFIIFVQCMLVLVACYVLGIIIRKRDYSDSYSSDLNVIVKQVRYKTKYYSKTLNNLIYISDNHKRTKSSILAKAKTLITNYCNKNKTP